MVYSTKHATMLDTKLDDLKDIIKKKTTQQQIDEYKDSQGIYNVVKNFVIDKNLVIYGGMALNELLPKSKKFYGKYDIKDIDCFSPNAKQHAIELSHLLFDRGFEYIEVKAGIHAGTFKVYSGFKSVADITQVTDVFYKYILKKARQHPTTNQSDKRLLIAPEVFLKWSLYKELSRPEGSIHRWEKIFERYLIFVKYFKEKNKTKLTDLKTIDFRNDKNLDDIVEAMEHIIKNRNFPLIGNYALGLHIGKNGGTNIDCCKMGQSFSTFEFLSTNIDISFAEIKESLTLPRGYTLFAKRRFVKDDFLGEVISDRFRGMIRCPDGYEFSLFTIIDTAENCFSVCDLEGYRVGTVDTILTFLYAYKMVYECFNELPKKQNINSSLIYVLEQHAYEIPNIKKRITTTCFGDEQTILNIKREKWNKHAFLYRPTIVILAQQRKKDRISIEKKMATKI
jgi:hypothetical protein